MVRSDRRETFPRPLDRYAGRYSAPDWGTIELTVTRSDLVARMGVATSSVEMRDGRLHADGLPIGGAMSVEFAGGRSPATAIEFLGVRFTRD